MKKEDQIRLFKTLGEETRYSIIKELCRGDKCACKIPLLINKTQSNTSMHLAKLLDWGILKYRKEGKRNIYSIKNKRVKEILEIAEKMKNA